MNITTTNYDRNFDTLTGEAVIIDTRGAEQTIQFSRSRTFGAPVVDLTINEHDFGFNDLWVETEEEQGYVAIAYDKRGKQYPVALETVFLSEEDFDSIDKEIHQFCDDLLEQARAASEEAFDAVIANTGKERKA
jgi:hypothetical protein